jgi:hypothetical protein
VVQTPLSPEIWETKFGMERFINGFLDLITIWFLSRFGKRPMHLFGAMGSPSLVFIIFIGVSNYTICL